jgi:drug/metabolite transporter (DMT)-like permease
LQEIFFRLQGYVFLSAAFALAGTAVIAARFLQPQLGPFTIAGTSLLIAVISLFPWRFSQIWSAVAKLSRQQWLLLLLQAFFGVFLFRFLLLSGLSLTSAGEAGILTGATPVITTLLAYLVLRESLDLKKIAGIGLACLGILMLNSMLTLGESFDSAHLLGNTLVLGAAASESLFSIFSRMDARKQRSDIQPPFDPLLQTLLVAFLAMGMCAVPATFENGGQALVHLPLGGWIALAWYGIVVTGVSFFFWYAGVKRQGIITAAAFSGMMPLTSFALAVVVLREAIVLPQCLGGVMIILGILIIACSDKQKLAH